MASKRISRPFVDDVFATAASEAGSSKQHGERPPRQSGRECESATGPLRQAARGVASQRLREGGSRGTNGSQAASNSRPPVNGIEWGGHKNKSRGCS